MIYQISEYKGDIKADVDMVYDLYFQEGKKLSEIEKKIGKTNLDIIANNLLMLVRPKILDLSYSRWDFGDKLRFLRIYKQYKNKQEIYEQIEIEKEQKRIEIQKLLDQKRIEEQNKLEQLKSGDKEHRLKRLKQFSSLIKTKLKEKVKNQSWLAYQLGCSRELVSLYCNGESLPRRRKQETITRLSSILKIPKHTLEEILN